jgi:hypothetical protein
MLEDIGAIASTFADATKHVVTERLAELTSATRDFTHLPHLRDYNNLVAERIDEFARYVKRTDIPEMLGDVSSFAKRQPMATLALGVVAGLVATQLIRGRTPRRYSPSSKRRASKANKRRAQRSQSHGALSA